MTGTESASSLATAGTLASSSTGALTAAGSVQAGLVATPAFNHMINVKLTRDNYLLWTAQLFSYLRSQGLMDYIDGTIAHPNQSITSADSNVLPWIAVNPKYTFWYQQDQLVVSAILSSITDEVLAQVVGCSSARKVWRAIEKAFSVGSRARTMQIHMQLATIQKKDLSVTDYFRRRASPTLLQLLASLSKMVS